MTTAAHAQLSQSAELHASGPASGGCAARIRASLQPAIDFPRRSSNLDEASVQRLQALAQTLQRCPATRLTVVDDGEDQCVGPVDAELSRARARAVVDALAARGVPQRRLRAVGVAGGKVIPSNPGNTLPSCLQPTPPEAPYSIDIAFGHALLPSPTPCADGARDPRCVPAPAASPSFWLALLVGFALGAAAAAAAAFLLLRARRRRRSPHPRQHPDEPGSPGRRNRIGIPAAVGPPDDLMLIKGVGPRLNTLLVSLGVRRFDQIAAWTPEEVAQVDRHLEEFHGRIQRDGWIEQADLLDRGAIDEFERRYGRIGSDE